MPAFSRNITLATKHPRCGAWCGTLHTCLAGSIFVVVSLLISVWSLEERRQNALFVAGSRWYHEHGEPGVSVLAAIAICRRLMAETTAEVQSVNAAVRAAEAQLAGRLSRPDLAALLRAVQEGERDKLRFTLVLQVTSPINPADT